MSLVLTATARSRVPGRCFRPLELVIQRGLPLESIVDVWMCGKRGGGGGGERVEFEDYSEPQKVNTRNFDMW